MKTVFEYKGYIGSAEVDVAGGTLHGKLLYIRDSISYFGSTVEDLRVAFHVAVDDYLAACAEYGDDPDQPLKGSFNVRVGTDRHRAIAIAARRKEVCLNEFVCNALDSAIASQKTHDHLQRWIGALTSGVLTNNTAQHTEQTYSTAAPTSQLMQ